MKDAGIIRNRGKIESVISNAREFQKIRTEYRSFPRYIHSFRGDEVRADSGRERVDFKA